MLLHWRNRLMEMWYSMADRGGLSRRLMCPQGAGSALAHLLSVGVFLSRYSPPLVGGPLR